MSAPAAFGLDPFWLSLALLLATYAVLTLDRINRAIVALIGATLMLLAGVLDQDRAIAGQDFNTLALLIGMMLLLAIARPSGMLQYLAFWSAKGEFPRIQLPSGCWFDTIQSAARVPARRNFPSCVSLKSAAHPGSTWPVLKIAGCGSGWLRFSRHHCSRRHLHRDLPASHLQCSPLVLRVAIMPR